jgi:hypothetical protein
MAGKAQTPAFEGIKKTQCQMIASMFVYYKLN